MDLIRTSFAVCAQNMRKWATDYRMWTIAALLFIMTLTYVDDVRAVAERIGAAVPAHIFPFLYSQYHTKVIFTLPVILMFCSAPFTDKNQLFVCTRISRVKWLCGQILYIITASAVYYIFIFLVSFFSTVFIGDASPEWGKTLNTIAYSTIAFDAQRPYVVASKIILEFFTPAEAEFFTFLTSWLTAILLGLIIFICNLFTQKRVIGIIASSFLVVWSVIVRIGGWSECLDLSPVSWNTLDNIDVGGVTSNPSFLYCLGFYLCAIALLTAAILIFGRRKSLDMKGD